MSVASAETATDLLAAADTYIVCDTMDALYNVRTTSFVANATGIKFLSDGVVELAPERVKAIAAGSARAIEIPLSAALVGDLTTLEDAAPMILRKLHGEGPRKLLALLTGILRPDDLTRVESLLDQMDVAAVRATLVGTATTWLQHAATFRTSP